MYIFIKFHIQFHFKYNYNKSYNNATEQLRRLQLFKMNWIQIKSHNFKFDKKETSYKMSINEYTDMEAQELQLHDQSSSSSSSYIDTLEYYDENMNIFEFDEYLQIPNEVDWREKGAVTPVKNQLPCGNYYYFN